MRTAGNLAKTQQQAGDAGPDQPAPRRQRPMAAPKKVGAEKCEGGGRMAGRKTATAAAALQIEAPMRQVHRMTAELGKIPGIAGRTVPFDD